MKRYKSTDVLQIVDGVITAPQVVLASDYDSLLAVLRRYVMHLEKLKAHPALIMSPMYVELVLPGLESDIAAAREYLTP